MEDNIVAIRVFSPSQSHPIMAIADKKPMRFRFCDTFVLNTSLDDMSQINIKSFSSSEIGIKAKRKE